MRIKSTRLIHGALFVAMTSLAACSGGGGGDSTAPATTYTIGGAVAGLSGSGLVLQNNGGDNLSVSANGTFTFATPLASGASYAVTVLTQPSGQTCTVNPFTGSVASANITSVTVICSSSAYIIGGSVAGLSGSGLVLQNNGGDDLPVSANGTFTFATLVASGATYAVAVKTQPSGQTCTVNSNTGTVATSNITTVAVTCSSSAYTIGGAVTGLTGSGLVLQNNGGDDLPISANGTFTFASPVASGATYTVTVKAQPSGQTCTVSTPNNTGTVASSNVTNVAVACTTATTTTTTYTIGGNVTGLTGTGLVLKDNGTSGETLSITNNGNFNFVSQRKTGDDYVVQVLTHPAGQTCSMANHVGMVSGANVTNVSVTCAATTYSIGGTITGLTADGLVLQNNGGDNLTVLASATLFTFNTHLATGAPYDVTVLTQPTGQTCTVDAPTNTGAVNGASVSNVSVTCSAATYPIGGTVNNLTGTGLVLQNNGGDDLSVTSGVFTFATELAYNSPYNVTVLTQPTAPAQICTVTNGSGAATAAVSVTVNCVNAYTVGGMIYGAADGVGPILQNNLGDNLIIPSVTVAGTPFTFTTPIANGATYSVTQRARARVPSQDCSANTPVIGTVNGGDVTGVTITCVLSTIVPKFAYVTNSNANMVLLAPDTVSAFTIDEVNGGMLTAASTPTTASGGGPYAVAVDPTGRFAYVVNSDTDSVSVYGIDPASGVLTLIDANDANPGTQASIATGDAPLSIAIDPSGKFVYVANMGNKSTTSPTGNTLSAYSINTTTGALTAIDADGVTTGAQTSIATGTWPYAIATDPLGRFVYVANYGSDTVWAYEINQTTGALTFVSATAAGTGPSSIAIDPTGKCALASNHISGSVTAYRIDQLTGALTAVWTEPAAGSNPRSVAIDPSTGLFAYVANAGSGDVSAYSIDLATCGIAALNADASTPALTIPAGLSPMSINVDPSGQFVYVANYGSDTVSVYGINLGGDLTLVQEQQTGAGPTSVTTSQ